MNVALALILGLLVSIPNLSGQVEEAGTDLEGRWTLVTAHSDGNEFAALKGATLRLVQGKKTFTLPGGKVERGTYRLDRVAKPRQIDTTTEGTAEAGKGIYRLGPAGKTLSICLRANGDFRPAAFKAEAGSGLLLLQFARAEEIPDQPKPAEDSRPRSKPGGKKLEGTRSFRMGFTGFVYDTTLPAVVASRKFCRENGDIIAHHIEGVPWAACLAGEDLPAAVLQSWKDKKLATPPAGKVYLAISPGRGGLKVIDKGGKLPAKLWGKNYAHPLVIETYLTYCRKSIDFFKPDYLAIGIEVNEIHSAGSKKWSAYLSLHEEVYRTLKKEYPKLPIFASFTLHNLYKERGAMLAELKKFMPLNDLVAVSYYPFFIGGPERLSALDWVIDQFEGLRKPFAMVETNDAAQTLRFPKAGHVIAGTPALQLEYHEKLLRLAQERRFEFVISFVHQDYDALWEKIKANSPELFMAWRDCGLLDENGVERPAYGLWRAHLDRPLQGGAKD